MTKEDVKKLLAKELTRVTPSSAILDAPKFEVQEDALAQIETTVEKETKEK